ncbi:MAG TPA: hypothetical protein PK408_02355, partial [Treponemataceae bacterium]|nr:hypothetical protein [Treponemataceae bacterium]
MEKKQDWFESESFWAQYSPVLFDTQRWAEAPDVAEGVLRIIGAGGMGKKAFDVEGHGSSDSSNGSYGSYGSYGSSGDLVSIG